MSTYSPTVSPSSNPTINPSATPTMFIINSTNNGSYFQFWEAESACNEMGSHLVSIHDETQYNESVSLCESVTHAGTVSKGCWFVASLISFISVR